MVHKKAVLTLLSGSILSAYGMVPHESSFQAQLEEAIARSLAEYLTQDDEFKLRLAKALSLSEYAMRHSEVNAVGAQEYRPKPRAVYEEGFDKDAGVLLPRDESLLRAIQEGRSVQEIRDLIADGANPNLRCPSGLTPLMLAAKLNQPVVCALLIGSQAELNTEDTQGNTPLDYAAQSKNLRLCRLLVARGAELNPISQNTTLSLLGRALARQVPFEIYRYLSRSGAKL